MDALTDTEAKAGLNQRKQCFEMRVAKRLNGEEISQDEIYEQEQRCALGRLRGEGKHGKVGSVRVGTGVVTSSKPGVLRPSTQVDRLALKPSNNAGIDIFLLLFIFFATWVFVTVSLILHSNHKSFLLYKHIFDA